MLRFRYNDKIYETTKLEKKLKKMHLTLDDIELIQDLKLELIETKIDTSIKLYTFINKKTGYRITTVYNNLDNYTNINKDEWEIMK